MMDMSLIIYMLIPLMVFMMLKNMGLLKFLKSPQKKEEVPRDAGERLQKYLKMSGKANPRNAKILSLTQTRDTPGRRIGRIKGIIPTPSFTKFIVKFNLFSFQKIIYCPPSKHTSLHAKCVNINAMGLRNISGLYFPIFDNDGGSDPTMHEWFKLDSSEVRKDIAEMMEIDLNDYWAHTIGQSIAGRIEKEELKRYEGPKEEVVKEGDE